MTTTLLYVRYAMYAGTRHKWAGTPYKCTNVSVERAKDMAMGMEKGATWARWTPSNTPPCSEHQYGVGSRHAHDAIAKSSELRGSQRLREEVRQIIRRAHEGHDDAAILHQFTNEEVAAIDVLRALMMLRIIV